MESKVIPGNTVLALFSHKGYGGCAAALKGPGPEQPGPAAGRICPYSNRDNPGVESYLSAGSVLFSLAQEVIEYQSKVAMDELLTKAARSLSQGTTRGGGIAYIRALLTQKQTFARGAQYLGLKALSVGASYLGIAASVISGAKQIQEGDSDAGTMVHGGIDQARGTKKKYVPVLLRCNGARSSVPCGTTPIRAVSPFRVLFYKLKRDPFGSLLFV